MKTKKKIENILYHDSKCNLGTITGSGVLKCDCPRKKYIDQFLELVEEIRMVEFARGWDKSQKELASTKK